MRLGLVLAYAGRAEEGIPYMQNALRLNLSLRAITSQTWLLFMCIRTL